MITCSLERYEVLKAAVFDQVSVRLLQQIFIENRRNIVRSANTGISAVINYKGEIIQSISYGEEGFIKSEVPLLKKITFYVKYGDYIFRISLFFLIIILLHFLATTLKN